MFDAHGTINCKDHEDGVIKRAHSLYIRSGWLPSITACHNGVHKAFYLDTLPNVENLQLHSDGLNINITWDANELYHTEVQIKYEDGSWVTLAVVEAGEGTI